MKYISHLHKSILIAQIFVYRSQTKAAGTSYSTLVGVPVIRFQNQRLDTELYRLLI